MKIDNKSKCFFVLSSEVPLSILVALDTLFTLFSSCLLSVCASVACIIIYIVLEETVVLRYFVLFGNRL